MQPEIEQEFSFQGLIDKESKRIYESLLKIRRNDPFYVCATKNKISFLSVGRTNSHHFTLAVDRMSINEGAVIIERIDLEAFKQALTVLKLGMKYEMQLQNNQLHFKTLITITTSINSYQCSTLCIIPLLMNCDSEQVKQLLYLQTNNTLMHLEFDDCEQFRMIASQFKAIKLHRIQFEVVPEQTSLRLHTYFETDYSMIYQFHFSNFKMLSKNITEKERFTYDCDEFLNSIAMIDKDSRLTILLTNNGTLLIGVMGAMTYSTKSLLSRIIVNNDY